MISVDMLLCFPDWKLPLTVHTDTYDKQLGAVISQNNKVVYPLSRRLSKPQRIYTKTQKELLVIVEFLKQFRRNLFGYEIKIFSNNKNLVHAATLSESQRVMRWRLIIEYFGHNIQDVAGVDNMVSDTLIILSSMPRNK